MPIRISRSPLRRLVEVEKAIRGKTRAVWLTLAAYLLILTLLCLVAAFVWYGMDVVGGWLTRKLVQRGFFMELP